MSEHQGRTAVITGASSGFGAIFAEQLAGRGMDLVLAGRDESRLTAVRRRVLEIAPGSQVELMPGDLGTAAGVTALKAQLDGRTVDLLVNNAGFGTYGAFADTDAERERGIVAVTSMPWSLSLIHI